MAPQRRSSDATQPPDPPVAPAASTSPPLHPAFALPGKDAFRDKAERDARKRAEQAARRNASATAASVVAPIAETPTPPRPKFGPTAITPPGPASEPKRPSAAIIPWPVREPVPTPISKRATRPVIASTDAPVIERPPASEPPKVDKPKSDPKPAPPAAPSAITPFSAAEFWGEKKKSGGGGGGGSDGGPGGGQGGGKGSGPSDGAQKTGAFNQDDVAGIVVVLLILLLIGWMVFNWFGKSPKDDRIVQPQAALKAPQPLPPTVKPDPFPAGPIDLKPKSPMPETALAEVAPAPAPALARSEPIVTAQAAPSPPTPAVSPVPATCTPGRMIHAYFCTSRSDLTPAARSALDADLQQWRSCVAGQELVVKGYADTRGSQELNVALGENRAKQLADILRAQGLNVSAVVGIGKLDGLDEGQNCLNQRRVDVGLKSEIDAATPSKACAPPKSVVPIVCEPSAPKPGAAAAASPVR